MISHTVQVDEVAVKDAAALFEFVGGNSDEALRIAINKTTPKIKTLASKQIRTQVRLQASYVGERLTVTKATRKRITGAIGTPTRGLLLSRFSTDPLIAGEKVGWLKPPLIPSGGIRVKIKPNASPTGAPGIGTNKPFYMVLNQGANVGIMVRTGKARKDVKTLYGPSLSQVFNTVRAEVLPAAGAELQAQLLDAMRYLLVKKYPPEATL
jgi:hypothetical protein